MSEFDVPGTGLRGFWARSLSAFREVVIKVTFAYANCASTIAKSMTRQLPRFN